MDYLGAVKELNYMTQIVLMLYEDPSKDMSSPERFRVELHFSPGAKGCESAENEDMPLCTGYRSASRTVSVDGGIFVAMSSDRLAITHSSTASLPYRMSGRQFHTLISLASL